MSSFPVRSVYILAAVTLLGGLLACTEDTPSEGGPLNPGSGASLDGLYALISHSENTAGCDVEGTQIMGDNNHTQFVVYTSQGSLFSTVTARSCSTPENCDPGYVNYYSKDFLFLLSEGNASDGYSNESSGGSNLAGGDSLCVGFRTDRVTLKSESENSVVIEKRSYITPDFPKPADGCLSAPNVAAAAAGPCSTLEVVRGQK